MKKHFLHVSLISDDHMELAKLISEKYGYGKRDYAIVHTESFGDVYFARTLDFLTLADFKCEIYAKNMKTAVDDSVLKKVMPYAVQTFRMMQRHIGFETTLSTFERLYFRNVEFWTAYLQQNNIEEVVFYTYPHEGTDFIIYQICLALDIKTIIFCLSVVPERCYLVSQLEDDIRLVQERFASMMIEYEQIEEENIELNAEYGKLFKKMTDEKSEKTPYYMEKKHIQKQLFWGSIKPYSAALKQCEMAKCYNEKVSAKTRWMALVCKLAYKDYRYSKGFFVKLLNKTMRRTQRMRNIYDRLSVEADYSDKYIYFPLHYQPECTSNPQGGGVYYEQTIPIRILAESLPDNIYVYVKEHPTQFYGARTEEFYDELLKIPKVRLIKNGTNTYELIKHCVAVSTLIGTAGWEGVFAGKPFIMFGYWATQHMPGVFHVRTKEQCKEAVLDILNGKYDVSKKSLKIYFKALEETEAYRLNPEIVENSVAKELRVSSCFEMFEKFYIKERIN